MWERKNGSRERLARVRSAFRLKQSTGVQIVGYLLNEGKGRMVVEKEQSLSTVRLAFRLTRSIGARIVAIKYSTVSKLRYCYTINYK